MSKKSIFDVQRSLALSASAGSGKTFVLTTRLIALLLQGVKPSDIMVVTFTNLAASDIRKKLFQRVAGLGEGNKGEIVLFASLLGEREERVQERCLDLGHTLVSQFSLLQISTVHGFFARMLKCFPRETGLIQDIVIIDEMERVALLAESFERFYSSLRENSALLERVFSFITHFRESTMSPGGALRDVYRTIESQRHVLEDFECLETDAEGAYGEFIERGRAFFSLDMRARMEFLIENLSRYTREQGSNRNVESFRRDLELFLRYGNVDSLAGITPFKKDGASYIERVRNFLQVQVALRFEREIADIRTDLYAFLWAQMRYYVSTWLEIHRRIDDAYRRRKEGGNFIDFKDIEERARGFLSLLSDFDYLHYRIGSQFRHILIDEFQDTSELQWEALRPIIRESLAGGGSLFYVGDEKQSIYRWRGGQPQLFEKVRKELNLEREGLRYSYRQNRVLLDFVNQVFLYIDTEVFRSYRYELQDFPKEKGEEVRGFVSIMEVDNREALLQEITNRIVSLRSEGVDLDDIAILCRKNSEIEELEKHFLKNRIPCRTAGKSRLFQDYSVLDMLGVIHFSLDPEVDIHLSGLLRSPLFRFTYEDLEGLKEKGGKPFIEVLKNAYPGIHQKLISLAARARFLSPTEFLRAAYEELNVIELYREKREVLLKLLELAYDFEHRNDSITLQDFVHYLEEKKDFLTLELSDVYGVMLLTIHAAKGLEFHTVILPFLNQPFRFRPDGSILFRRDSEGRITFCMIARSIYRDYFSGTPEVDELLESTDEEYKIDELNTLYVALTRARENLLIFPLRKGPKESMGKLLIQSIDPTAVKREALFKWERGTPTPGEGDRGSVKREMHNLKRYVEIDRERLAYPLPFGEEMPGEDIQSRRIGLLKGLIFHRALESISRITLGGEELSQALIHALASEGRAYTRAERESALNAARTSLMNAISDRRLERYFSTGAITEGLFLSREYPNLIGRIDRVLVNEAVEVLDFKTNCIYSRKHLDELVSLYRGQVIAYCRSMERLYAEKKIRGFLYFTDADYDSRLVRVV
ncbi:MAG: hypothetical protein AMS17_05445 [Spirochaetes bacterium DG_61]|nr:MAG: hypothetical protein AMS17_05445 [Spirochaetes bacterium DG_61]